MKTKLVLVVGLVMFLLPAMAFAGSACATPTEVPASGGSTDFDFIAAGGKNFYEVNVKPNRSYSIEVLQDYDDLNTDLTTTVFSDTVIYDALPGIPVFEPEPVPTDGETAAPKRRSGSTKAAEPAIPNNGFRGSFITGAAVANPSYRIQVVHGNAAGTGRYIRVSVAETTLFSPLYTTFSGFNTFYRVYNTTSQSISGTLTAVGPTGAAAGTPVTLTVAPYSSSLTIYTGVTVPNADLGLTISANNAGPAFFVHNGPPAGILIDGFSSNGTAVLPIKFVSVREIR